MKEYQLAQIEKISHILGHIGDVLNDLNMEISKLIRDEESGKKKRKKK